MDVTILLIIIESGGHSFFLSFDMFASIFLLNIINDQTGYKKIGGVARKKRTRITQDD
jgi:hypothetical protein